MNPSKIALLLFLAALLFTPACSVGQTFESLSSRRVHNQKPKQEKLVIKHRNRRGTKTFTKVPVNKPKLNPPIIYRPNFIDPALARIAIEAQGRAAAQRQAANPRFGSPVFGPTTGAKPTGNTKIQPAKTESPTALKTTPTPVAPLIIKSPFAKFNDGLEPKTEETPKKKGGKSIENPFHSDIPGT